ncbi:uncharacterized protein LOC143030165 [Oratosquilla oratoria]|uniref:uncharacterized protein LOC143030165 n=1 Tax=Oratosquilla oratoria TaxID=337810 RepID=UPI003F77636F
MVPNKSYNIMDNKRIVKGFLPNDNPLLNPTLRDDYDTEYTFLLKGTSVEDSSQYFYMLRFLVNSPGVTAVGYSITGCPGANGCDVDWKCHSTCHSRLIGNCADGPFCTSTLQCIDPSACLEYPDYSVNGRKEVGIVKAVVNSTQDRIWIYAASFETSPILIKEGRSLFINNVKLFGPVAKVMAVVDETFGEGDVRYTIVMNPFFSFSQLASEQTTFAHHVFQGVAYKDSWSNVGPTLTCKTLSSRPEAEFNGTNANHLVEIGMYHYTFKVKSTSTDVVYESDRETEVPFFCQRLAVIGSDTDAYLVPMQNTTFKIPVVEGGPLAFEIIGIGQTIEAYMSDAGPTGRNLIVPITTETPGHYPYSAKAKNKEGMVRFTGVLHVVPLIIEDEWILTSDDPKTVPPGLVTITFEPVIPLAYPPWVLNITITSGDIVLLADEVWDLMTDGNRYGAILFEDAWEYTLNFTSVLSDGVHTLTLNASNEMFWGTWDVVISLYKPLGQLKDSFGFMLTEGGVLYPGGGIEQNVLPTKQTVEFVTEAGQGYVEKWGLFVGDDLLVESNTTISYVFTEEGHYNLTLKAYNFFEGWVAREELIYIEVLNRIEGLAIMDFNVTEPYEEKVFEIAFSVLHAMTAMLMDFDDGSEYICLGEESMCQEYYPSITYVNLTLDIPTLVSHVYEEEGAYNPSALAFDLMTSIHVTLPIVVMYPSSFIVICDSPEVSIFNSTRHPLGGTSYYNSESIRLMSKSNIYCEGPVTSRKKWRITKVRASETAESIADLDIEGKVEDSFAELILPPHFLEPGVYQIFYALTLETHPLIPLVRTAYTFIKIIEAPLVAALVDGVASRLARARGQVLELNAKKYSFDTSNPDAKNFEFTWFCRSFDYDPEFERGAMGEIIASNLHNVPSPKDVTTLPPDVSISGCFNSGPGILNTTTGNLVLNTASFPATRGVFEVTVVIRVKTRFASAKLEVELQGVPSPEVVITCADPLLCVQRYPGVYFRPTTRLALRSKCIFKCADDMKYSWTITLPDGGPVNESCHKDLDSRPSENTCIELIPIGKKSSDISFHPAFFSLNPGVPRFHLSLFYETPKYTGQTIIYIFPNQPPVGGSCSINPSVGRSIMDTFFVECVDWKDPEEMGIEEYTLLFYEELPGMPKQKNIVYTHPEPNGNLILPCGNFTIFAQVLDNFGSFTETEVGTVQARKSDVNMCVCSYKIFYDFQVHGCLWLCVYDHPSSSR